MKLKFLIVFLSLLMEMNSEVFCQDTYEEQLWKKTFFSIEDALRNPSKIRSLYIEDTSLTELPYKIKTLKKLEWLKISKTQIKEIPTNARTFNNLRFLYLEANNRLDIGNVLQSLNSHNISKISISKSNMEFLPEDISRFVELTELYLYNNNLKVLPNEIGNLKALESLLLANNELEHLPYSMTNLKGLKTLSLNGNSFIELPEFLPKLSSLNTIFIGNAELDKQQTLSLLGECKSLKIIHISEMEFSRVDDFQELKKIPNLINLIFQDVFINFEDIPLKKLSRLNFKIIIITSLKLTNDQLSIVAPYSNVKIERVK